MSEGSDRPPVAVLGQGSVGRRHAGNLLELGCSVVVFDPRPEATALEGTRRAASEREALEQAGAAVIASPSSEHARQAQAALEHGCHVLVEKPLAITAEEADPLIAMAAERSLVLAVAMNLRFHPGPATVKRIVEGGQIGQPLYAHFTFGYHLPSWRPGTDYRESYSARRELGGGVLLDAIHELDYATWVLGPAAAVSALLWRSGQLEIDVEDVALLQLQFEGCLATIELDYLDRVYRRGCRVVGSEGTVDWSWPEERVVLAGPDSEEVIPTPSDVTPTYKSELAEFLKATDGDAAADVVSASEARHVLALVDAARWSSDERRWAGVDGR